ncbi:hypothetical protein QZH41_018272 [Actinostola sp. cb2023]|nr:hypothetical protein QZH41_018272 [Actinostola sp. cb2023]
MSPYQKRGKSPDPVGGSKKKSKDEVRQERKLARKESRSKINVDEVLYVEEMPEVQQSPESFDGPQTNVVTDKPQNVNKLDLNQFSQFQQKTTVVENTRRRSVKKSAEVPSEKVDADEDNITKSFSDEAEEKQRRLVEREKERIRRENEERELLLLEQQRQRDSSPTRETEDDEAEEKRARLVEMEKERIRRENEEKEILLLEKQRQRRAPKPMKTDDHVVKETTVQEVHSAPTDFDDDVVRSTKYEEKPKKSVDFDEDADEEADEKRRRLVELEKNRIRRESEERELLLREQESQREGRTDVVKVNTVQEVQSVPENFDDEKSIDDKPKTVAPSSQKPEDFVVKETTVQEVHSAPTDFDDDEKYEQKPKKSVGKLDFDKITKSFGEEAEEKRRRLVERERERIRREKEEKDILLLEQQRQNESSSSVETRQNVVDEVQSTPTASKTGRLHNDRDSTIDREREEQYSVEEKRKSVSKLDIGNIMQSFREEDDMKRRRAMELEHDRRLRDEEEKNLSRLERQRAKNTSSTVQVSVAQEVHASASEDIFFEEKPTSSKPDLVRKDSEKSQEIQENHTEMQSRSTIRYEYDEDDGASQNKKAVGRLDLQRFSQSIDQETRERERRGRELEIERLRLERDEMEGRGVNQSTSSERADGHGDRSEGQSEESGGYSRPVPKRLDLSKFSAFQGGLRVTKDDTAVKRRDKSSGRQVRPKSIAGTSFKGVANGDAGYADIEYRIVK